MRKQLNLYKRKIKKTYSNFKLNLVLNLNSFPDISNNVDHCEDPSGYLIFYDPTHSDNLF